MACETQLSATRFIFSAFMVDEIVTCHQVGGPGEHKPQKLRCYVAGSQWLYLLTVFCWNLILVQEIDYILTAIGYAAADGELGGERI